jgi:DNA adenine methylase
MGKRKMTFYSPLRYPGGKFKIVGYFKKILARNFLYDCTYVEPYTGGASVALSLLMEEYVSKIIINDIDKSIYAFWYSVLNHTDELCSLIQKTPITVSMWQKQKKIQSRRNECTMLELGFSTFFLNRTNRSGIINAGCIGGKSQLGEWKINARFNKNDLIERIRKIALYKDRIELYNLDAVALINLLKKDSKKKYLFYLDPPYYVKGKELYLNFYSGDDHKKIATTIQNIDDSSWIITYDNVMPIRALYNNFPKKIFKLNYSAGRACSGEEIMIFSKNLYVVNQPVI